MKLVSTCCLQATYKEGGEWGTVMKMGLCARTCIVC